MTLRPAISVVIPAYNAARTIAPCLSAVLNQTAPRDSYEIIVVDDASGDGTGTRAQAHAGVQIVSQPHAGPAAARNLGAQLAKGDILLFTDADCAPSPDWVERMAAPLADETIVGIKGAYLSRQPEVIARFVQLEYEAKYDRMERHQFIDFVDTYAAGYRRELFLANGGFDPIFPHASVEDQELSFRLASQGHKMLFVRDASVYHLAHPTGVVAYWCRKFTIGLWKVLVMKRHRDKVWHDSHTPQSLKVQILLVALGLLSLVTALFWTPVLWGSALVMLFFILSTLPFASKAWGKDPTVAIVSPLLLLLRALALGMGFALGLVSQQTTSREPGGMANERDGASLAAIDAPGCQGPSVGRWGALSKRVVDLLGAAVGLLLSLPVICVAAVLIKLDSPGPIFFVQDRVGENGKVFGFYKLRTMVVDAESLLDELIDLDALDEPVFKLKDDPRVTRVGRFLRRWSIDELPQFLNVLKGDVSLVGPRPEEVRVVRYYKARHKLRLCAKPGITGPVQVKGRGDLSLEERVSLETDYIKNYSLGQDLQILLRTIPAVIRGNGSY